MGVCILDGKEIKDREQLHDALADSLGFPEWYGRNLDALYDCLTELHEDTEVRLLNESEMKQHLGEYAGFLAEVLRVAAEENPKIRYVEENVDQRL